MKDLTIQRCNGTTMQNRKYSENVQKPEKRSGNAFNFQYVCNCAAIISDVCCRTIFANDCLEIYTLKTFKNQKNGVATLSISNTSVTARQLFPMYVVVRFLQTMAWIFILQNNAHAARISEFCQPVFGGALAIFRPGIDQWQQYSLHYLLCRRKT